MKAGKIILVLFLAVVLILGVGVWYLFHNKNSLIRELIIRTGTDVLQTPVSLEKVDIKLTEGSGELNVFAVANYEGYAAPNLIVVETVKLDLDPTSVVGDVIVIEELEISGISIVAEQKGTSTNLQSLLKSLSSGESSETTQDESESEDIKLAVEKLRFVNNSLSLATEDYGTHTLSLPEIVQTDIGSRERGLTPEQLAAEIVKPLIAKAKQQVEKGIKDLAKAKLEEKYGEQIEKEKNKLKEKLQDTLGEDAEEKLKGLKDLF